MYAIFKQQDDCNAPSIAEITLYILYAKLGKQTDIYKILFNILNIIENHLYGQRYNGELGPSLSYKDCIIQTLCCIRDISVWLM